MLKKSLTLITMLCAMVPMVAYAASWSLATRVSTVGGTITSRNTAAAQTSANGTVFKTYTTQANVPVTITANSGYAISAVSVNGVAQALPLSANPVQMGLTAFPGKSSQGVVVSFTAQTVLVPVTIDAAPGGTATPVGTFNVKQGSAATVTFSPNTGNSVTSITNLPAGATVKDSATGAAVTLPYAGAVKVSFTVPATSLSLTGNYGVALAAGVTATTGAYVGAPVTLTASATIYNGGAASYAWTELDGPATVVLSGNPATFTPAVAGVYTFKVTATNSAGSSSATIQVPVSAAAPVPLSTSQTARTQCINCHTSAGVGQGVFAIWSSSQHDVNAVLCYNCHIGANTGAHPGPAIGSAGLENVCLNCHNSTVMPDDAEGPNYLKSSHYANPYGEGVVYCASCHDPHFPTMGIYSTNHQIGFYTGTTPTPVCTKCHTRSAGKPYGIYSSNGVGMAPHFDPTNSGAVAYTNNRVCTDCHGHNNAINSAYKQSGHADVTSSAWAEGGGSSPCVRCHTTTGFINYSSFHVVTPLATPIKKEVLACNACHTSPDMNYSAFGNLTSVDGVVGTIRHLAPYPATYSQSGSANVSFQFPDVGPSNVCVPCHSGRVSGKNIQGLTSNMSNTGFKNSHYRAAAGILYRSIGFEYYTSSQGMYTDPADANSAYFEHYLIGSTVTNADGVSAPGTGFVGPCAGCHMYAPDGNGPGHTLHVFTKDTNGAVTAINNSICVGCHTAGGDPGALDFSILDNVNAQITGFQAALGALQALLQTNGAYYSSATYPYFFKDSTYNTSTGTLTDWTFGTNNNTVGKKNMGAAFNLNLLTREPGAYAHNRYYAMRLIFDAIDWLQNGSMTGTINISNIANGAPDGHGGTTPAFDSNAAAVYLGTTRP